MIYRIPLVFTSQPEVGYTVISLVLPETAECASGSVDEWLGARTSAAWDEQIVTRLHEMILSGRCVLDGGCGYRGRIAIPLAKAGYDVAE